MSQHPKDHAQDMKTSRRRFLKMAAVAGGMLGFPGISQAASSQPGSPGIIRTSSKSGRPSITIAGYPFDRVKGLVDGKVQVEGCKTQFEVSSIYKLNARWLWAETRSGKFRRSASIPSCWPMPIIIFGTIP